ncbi:response regulator [Microvirga lotononidis]|uniref:Regulatory protein VirG n=1 Tax=Microvirga lotononidis TaxID=864069 RepID=I4YXY1_9HYPH|nr:response regulator [Microvirga lotononidis]EIM28823.1 response regulator with CheY-like receiver domain and winged-helix DNA-binding domain [Microvirga lotononidis]WQO25449.1 response regulator [Microvirga lotononidis]
MTDAPHILIVDDDARIRQMISRYLADEGFQVSAAANGEAMRECLTKSKIDLVLLDLVLPGEDGFQLAREVRARPSTGKTGIIMLTGRSDMVDMVVGLEVGADDYIAKPFHLREVLARIRSVLRRTQPTLPLEPSPMALPHAGDVIRFDGWRLDLGRRELKAPNGAEITLTTGEFELLATFARHPGRVLNRDQLMDLTRGRHWEAIDRSIDAQVARLRRKIETDPKHPMLVKSVRGVGYVFTGHVQ